jgi:hypothetical protein
MKTTIRTFRTPDVVRRFEHGTFEILEIGSMMLGRASYAPGWRWSTHVGALAGEPLCRAEHVGIVLAGRAAVQMATGDVVEMGPGDVFHVLPGHDSWVIGDEPYVSLHLLGAEEYAVETEIK